MADPQRHFVGAPSSRGRLGTTVGRFAIQSRLGSGGMGEVYLAEDKTLKRPVALKCLSQELRADPWYRQRLIKEAERASAFTHPNIASIYDIFEERGDVFLVLEYVDGVSLRERFRTTLSLDQFLAMAVQTAEALAAAHEKGILHADIKPENIMLVRDSGRIKVLDFGVAKRLPRSEGDHQTQSSASRTAGALSGTPAYMAPEVLLEREIDHRADIFSLGVVFYEAVTGRHPFRESSFMATADRVLHHTPPPLRQVDSRIPEGLERIVGKMLAKDPADRYATAADLVVDLRVVQRGEALVERTPLLPRPVLVRWRPQQLVAVLLAVAIVAAVASYPLLRRPVQRLLGWQQAVPADKYVAVLPIEVTRGDPETRYFADGLTEALTAKLNQLTAAYSLQVAPAADVRRLRGAAPQEAGKQLGVNLAVIGSLQRWGDDVRVTVSLVNARERKQLRAETIDASWRNPLALEDRVVSAVLEMLEVELQAPERKSLEAHGTQVAAAYDAYLRGRGYLQNYDNPQNVERAISTFHQALVLDAGYALALAGLGEAYWRKYQNSFEPRWVDSARQACARALSLDGKLSAAHQCLGTVFHGTGRYEQAVAEFNQAIAADSSNDAAYRGLAAAYQALGKLADAEQTYRRAIQLRPNYWGGYSWLGRFYFDRARYPEAAAMFQRVIALTPDNVRGYANLGGIYVAQGRYNEALPMLEKSISILPSTTAYSNVGTARYYLRRFPEAATAYESALKLSERDSMLWGNLADTVYWIPSRRGQAASAYQKAIALGQEELRVNPRNAESLSRLAKYHAALGERSQAIALLERARAVGGYDAEVQFDAAVVYARFGDTRVSLDHLEKALAEGFLPARVQADPLFDGFKANPRFERLMKR